MELEKIRNLGDNELAVEANKAAEQLFRLRFQLTLGQTDAIKKVRLLRKDIARFKTIVRERELGLHGAEHKADVVAAEKTEKRAAIELINGDFAAARLRVLLPACADLAEQLKTLPWANEAREQEHQGYANDMVDSLLYGWRAHRAYLNEAPEQPKARPTPDSDEWIAREEAEFARRSSRSSDDEWYDA